MIVRRLALGGMGVLYLARDLRFGRSVAIKVPRPSLRENPWVRDCFAREARVAALLGHPGIVEVLDVGWTDDGLRFIVMEVLEGERLSDRIDRLAPMAVGETCRLIVGALDGLGAAHRRGVTHRDVKPDNVWIARSTTGRETVKLLDFGLARFVGEPPTPYVMGTPAYMAPERAAGEDGDARSDLWSVGVILFEMLTGLQAFPGDEQEALNQIVTTDLPRVGDSVQGVPPALEAAVARATSRDPAERFGSAEALASVLQPFARGRWPDEPWNDDEDATAPFPLCRPRAEPVAVLAESRPSSATRRRPVDHSAVDADWVAPSLFWRVRPLLIAVVLGLAILAVTRLRPAWSPAARIAAAREAVEDVPLATRVFEAPASLPEPEPATVEPDSAPAPVRAHHRAHHAPQFSPGVNYGGPPVATAP